MHTKNNLDFLRLLFASFVIITHSYPLTGKAQCDWLCQLTNNQIVFSWIGVKGFFVISGFLIFQSLQRSKNLVEYFWKRFLRLYPGLFLVLFLTILLAPFVYNGTTPYLSNRGVWSYIPNNLTLYRGQFAIDGVFDNNPYKGVVNGSLWTIVYEVAMYVILSVLFFVRSHKNIVRSILIVLFLVFIYFTFRSDLITFHYGRLWGAGVMEMGAYFLAGSLLASLGFDKLDKRRLQYLCLLSFVSLLVVLSTSFFIYFKHIVFPVLIMSFGLSSFKRINNIGQRFGDISYGVYLFAFPVQQTLVYYYHLDVFSLMAISSLITYVLAYLSWHLVESKALKLKNYQATYAWRKLSPIIVPIFSKEL